MILFIIGGKVMKKYTLNEGFFDTLDRNSSYVLGFWAADGFISKMKLSYTWGLVQKDQEFLQKIADTMGSNHPIKERKGSNGCYGLRIYNKRLYEKMIEFGFSNRKSSTMVFPEMSKENRKHFIRGYFDGDGCVMLQKSNQLKVVFTCGDRTFLARMKQQLKEDAGLKGGSISRLKASNAYQLGYSTNDSLKIKDYIYNEADLFLSRKKETFMKFKPSKSMSRSFEVTFPDQTKEIVKNLSEFQRNHNLPSLGNVMNTDKSYRGFKVKRLT
jgi:hypothetical protein